MPDIVSGSRHFVPVTRNSYRSSVYDILLKFEKLPVNVTGRNKSCPSHMKSCRTVTDDRRLFHAVLFLRPCLLLSTPLFFFHTSFFERYLSAHAEYIATFDEKIHTGKVYRVPNFSKFHDVIMARFQILFIIWHIPISLSVC